MFFSLIFFPFRADKIVSAYVFREKVGDPDSSTLTSMLQLDLKGWLPTAMVNSGMAAGLQRVHSDVKEFYFRTYKAECEGRWLAFFVCFAMDVQLAVEGIIFQLRKSINCLNTCWNLVQTLVLLRNRSVA